MTEPLSLSGRVAVVTGATRGLGLATAEFLANLGADVSLCSRNAMEADQVAEHLSSAFNVRARGFGVDIANSGAVIEFAAASANELAPASILVNNAAILGPIGLLGPSSLAEWSHALDVNTKGPAFAIAAFREQLIASPHGRIINLSGGGIGGPSPMERVTSYVTSKAAVAALTEALAAEFNSFGVTVNALAPGALPTTFLSGVLGAGRDSAGSALFDDAAHRGAVLTPELVAPFLRLLSYVLQPEADWLTGRVLSARWDTDAVLDDWRRRELGINTYRLRRIDEDLFGVRS